jgi:hypothetical protein
LREARVKHAWLVAVVALAGCGGGRDVVPPSNDVISNEPTPGPRTAGSYQYVARRPGAVVGLAEARGIPDAVARAAVDHVADALASCAAERARGGDPGGAARLVAHVDGNGVVGAASLRLDPGAGPAASAVLCFVAPVKSLVFSPIDAGGERGLALEALWGRGANGP